MPADATRIWTRDSGTWLSDDPGARSRAYDLCPSWTRPQAFSIFQYADPDTQPVLREEAALCLATMGSLNHLPERDMAKLLSLSLEALAQWPRRAEISTLADAYATHAWGRDDAERVLQVFAAYPDEVTAAARRLLAENSFLLDDFQLVDTSSQELQTEKAVAVALDFSGKARRVYWRLAEDFVAGFEQENAREKILFYDYPSEVVPPATANVIPDLWVGPVAAQETMQLARRLPQDKVTHIGFFAQSPEEPPVTRLVQTVRSTISALLTVLQAANIQTLAVVAPLDETGNRQVAELLRQLQNSSIRLVGIERFRPDLADIGHKASRLYGQHKFHSRQLEEMEKEERDIEGTLQQDLTIVFGNAEQLPRVFSELKYFGSNFQVFASDFNAHHPAVASTVAKVPVIFVDHFAAAEALPAELQQGYSHYEERTRQVTAGKPFLLDLLLYEAGQWAAKRPQQEVTLAAGIAIRDEKGIWQLPQYAMQIVDGKTSTLDPEWLLQTIQTKKASFADLQRALEERRLQEMESKTGVE